VNCTVIQRRLLSAEQPEQPATDITSHLAQCPACRAWQRRLVQMERHIPLLPVPPSPAKALLLQRLRADAARPTAADPLHLWHSARAPGAKERGLRKVAVAFALAASLLVFALTWWAWPHNPVPSVDTAQREQVRLEERLTTSLRGETAKERVLSLAALAEQVHGEARRMVGNHQRLERWARFYSRVVGQHLMEQARQVPAEDRPAVMEAVAMQLQKTESDASRFAAQLQTRSPRSAASFEQIALAARNSERDLRAMMKS
jgi:hypothetical protein